jgi:hypothetical protein
MKLKVLSTFFFVVTSLAGLSRDIVKYSEPDFSKNFAKKLLVAYHESGHALACILLPETTLSLANMTLVPVVQSSQNKSLAEGATRYRCGFSEEMVTSFTESNYPNFIARYLALITVSLAGGASQCFGVLRCSLPKEYLSVGCRCDNADAKYLVHKMMEAIKSGWKDKQDVLLALRPFVFHGSTLRVGYNGYAFCISCDSRHCSTYESKGVVNFILDMCSDFADALVAAHKEKIDTLARELVFNKTLHAQQIYQIFRRA